MTRIFLTSSHLSSIIASIIAKKESREGDQNILVIDNYFKKESLIKLIYKCDEIFHWTKIIDLSEKIQDTTDLKPGLKKTILRKIKTLPVIAGVYRMMLEKHQEKYAAEKTSELISVFNENGIIDCDELYMLTQTALNSALSGVFPKSEICYYEHGLGDYYYVLQKKESAAIKGVFGVEFDHYLESRNIKNKKSTGGIGREDFEQASSVFYPLIQNNLNKFRGKKSVLFLMDALEGYNPPQHFWTDYLDQSLGNIDDLKDYVVIVKPHPNQSNGVIELTKNYLSEKKINFVVLEEPIFISMSVEIVYTYLKNDIKYLVSTFSSAIFYLAKFYPENSKFLLMYDFVEKYIGNAPKQYVSHFYGLKPLIEEVFMSPAIEKVN
jgi:hypothetical protein